MNIILIGFMGSGKSSVARKLAQKLNYKNQETDESVLIRSGRKSITELFKLDGEIVFREMELTIAKKMSGEKNAVISTGGGMVINKLCIDYFKQNGIVVYLQTSFEEIVKRLAGDETRPLFKDKLVAHTLFKFRKHLYEEYADITIKTDKLSVDEITNSVIEKI